jgi:hypothetical protein
MITLDEDIAAARRAVHRLEQAAAAVTAHYSGDSPDARRLAADVARLAEDLDLLCGAEKSAPAQAAAPAREIIEDRDYEPDFWRDAEDEGLGSHINDVPRRRPGGR